MDPTKEYESTWERVLALRERLSALVETATACESDLLDIMAEWGE